MSTYHDLPTEELEALMYKVHGECDAASAATQASLAKCDKGVKKLETHLRDEKALIHKAGLTLAEHTATVVAPHILAAYKKLPNVELKLKVAEFENKRKTEECECLKAKHLGASKLETRPQESEQASHQGRRVTHRPASRQGLTSRTGSQERE